jgi:hypothetical protein
MNRQDAKAPQNTRSGNGPSEPARLSLKPPANRDSCSSSLFWRLGAMAV